jgi:hypothetical protein
MPLSPRVGGATSKPVDVSPSPASQRFASNSCVTTKMTYEFFNELIENFTLAQVAYGVTNVPNDPNSLKKILDGLRTNAYNFTIATLGTDTIIERTTNNGVSVENVLLKDGSVEVLGSSNYFGSLGDLNLVVDSNNNGTNQFNIYNHSIATANQLMSMNENGDLSVFSRSGSDMLKLIDVASNETTANPYISLGYNTSVGSTFNRIGVMGFIADTNKDLAIVNETTNGNIELITNGQTSIKSQAGGDVLSIVDTNAATAILANPIISFDYSTGGAKTRAGYVGYGSTGNDSLYLFNDTGNIILSPATDIIDVSNSRITQANAINFGNEDLSLYRENITFTATFYNGTTQITGSSGVTNVSTYDARFTRIGDIVTVNISNIVLDVAGACGTTLGSYPALTTTGEFSIRGLPYNALKDSFGSYLGFYNGSGSSNAGSVYIIQGTNNIRFSTTGFGATFGIRGVTITYMV